MTATDANLRLESRYQPLAGNLFYRTRTWDRRSRQLPRFPTPHIRPRQRRHQSIHVISYPPGYIPSELRLDSAIRPKRQPQSKKWKGKEKSGEPVGNQAKGSHLSQYVSIDTLRASSAPATARPDAADAPTTPRRPTSMYAVPLQETLGSPDNSMMLESRRSPMLSAALGNSHRSSIMSVRSAKSIMSSVTEVPKPVASGSGLSCSIILAEPNIFLTGFEHDGHARHELASSTALLRGKLQLNVSKNVKLKSVTLKLSGRARTEWPEGIPPMKIEQFEEESLRTQVLTFFNAMHDTWETEYGNQCTYSLRGGSEVQSKPEGTVSRRLTLSPIPPATSLALRDRSNSNLTAREYKRLSLQSVQSRSFGKGDSPSTNSYAAMAKGYKVFYPGTYEYTFELPIDHHQLETTKLQFGSVKWELETIVERAGAFKPNLHGSKEVLLVRVPDQLSLEMTEPISISRQWEDQLHYDIMISGKSFPIGSKIPIAFKLTPLAKVQVHKLKVFVTESIEYWTNDRRVTRKDPGRKILLLEKSAGKPLDKQYEASEIRVLSGGELSPDERHEARLAAQRRRSYEASRTHTVPQPLPDRADNLLGDLDLGLESYWGPTEMEMNVQIPTCEQMAKDKTLCLHPDCSWKNVNVFHWIKIVMRISRLDPEDPAGKRRRHFEISIDSPFTVLNCRATHANTALPEYSGAEQPTYRQQSSCGCPDAEVIATNPSPASSTGTIPPVEAVCESPGLALPPAAHLQHHPTAAAQAVERPAGTQQAPSSAPRPIHFLRYPSFNPPAFDADDPPPPMPTPPPRYDVVVGTPSVDGLADYFARLADYDDAESDEDEEAATPSRLTERTGRVNVPHPRTPGGRLVPSRSLDIQRPMPSNMPLIMPLNIAGALQERRG
ncbi:hypothetical protein DL763_005593 [Monosporascus cannonballus]|nr:hypothetical protein DL763_005593 [Monosporascus cannonballus]